MLTALAKLFRVAERQHSAFTGAQARQCGLSQDSLERQVRAGVFVREYRAVFRVGGARRTFETQAMAAVLAAGPGAVASFFTAATLLGLDDMDGRPVHITVPDRRCVRLPGVFVHRPVEFAQRDATRVGVIPATSPSRTLIDLAGALSATALEDLIDDARRRDLINVRTLARRVGKMTPQGRRGVLLLRRLLADRIGQAVPGSKWESRLLALLADAGLPLPLRQYEIRDESGRVVARPDLVYPDERLYIEFESEQFHSSRSDWERDLERQNVLVAMGYAPLRVSKKQMTKAPDGVCRHVSACLGAARAAKAAQIVARSR